MTVGSPALAQAHGELLAVGAAVARPVVGLDEHRGRAAHHVHPQRTVGPTAAGGAHGTTSQQHRPMADRTGHEHGGLGEVGGGELQPAPRGRPRATGAAAAAAREQRPAVHGGQSQPGQREARPPGGCPSRTRGGGRGRAAADGGVRPAEGRTIAAGSAGGRRSVTARTACQTRPRAPSRAAAGLDDPPGEVGVLAARPASRRSHRCARGRCGARAGCSRGRGRARRP